MPEMENPSPTRVGGTVASGAVNAAIIQAARPNTADRIAPELFDFFQKIPAARGTRAATSVTLYCALTFLSIAAACIADGSSNTLWMRKAPASHKASILALVHMTTVFTKAGALLGGGLLVDHLLEPAMAASGALAQVLGPWLGVGKGRGIALLFVASGCIGLVLSLAALAWRRTRRIDFAHPDGDAEAPGAVLN